MLMGQLMRFWCVRAIIASDFFLPHPTFSLPVRLLTHIFCFPPGRSRYDDFEIRIFMQETGTEASRRGREWHAIKRPGVHDLNVS